MKVIAILGSILAPVAVWVALYTPNPSSAQKAFAGIASSFIGLQVFVGSLCIED